MFSTFFVFAASRTPHDMSSRGTSSVNGDPPTDTPTISLLGGSHDKESVFSKDHALSGLAENPAPSSTPVVYTWGGCTSLPIKLDLPLKETNAELVGVACGRNQRAGVTKDGKLFFWKVSEQLGLNYR